MRKKFAVEDRTVEHGKAIIEGAVFSDFRKQKGYRLRSVWFSKKRRFGFGVSGLDLSKRVPAFDMCIGIKPYDLEENLSDADFVKFIVTGMHEVTHLRQYLKGLKEVNYNDLALILLANRHNSSCYNLGQNYFSDLSEVDAEINGIFMAREALMPIFGDRTDTLLADYVNNRISEFRQANIKNRENHEINGRKYHDEQDRPYFFLIRAKNTIVFSIGIFQKF